MKDEKKPTVASPIEEVVMLRTDGRKKNEFNCKY